MAGRTESEDHQKNKGDILAVHPHPFNWGAAQIKIGLILIVESTKTIEEMQDYTRHIYEHKVTEVQIPTNELDKLTQLEQDDYVFKKTCSYNINQAVLKTFLTDLDDTKMESMTTIYQPCKDSTQLVQKFDGKNKNRLIKESDVDTVSVKASANNEFSISLASAMGLIVSNI